jgi:hypothetical protein
MNGIAKGTLLKITIVAGTSRSAESSVETEVYLLELKRRGQ